MASWNTTPAADDFIIPDDDEPRPSERTPVSGAQNAPNTASTNIFSSFSAWTPKVDLSSTFTPFTGSLAFQENNTIRERQYSGGDTLDEPVWDTLKRDLMQIYRRLTIVVWPMQLAKLASNQQQKFISFANSNGIQLPQLIAQNHRVEVAENDDEDNVGVSTADLMAQETLDWDLWGPLIFSLVYSVTMGISASKDQMNLAFSGSFSLIWLFYIVIGLNIQLLGGNISFMSAISAAGYSMFPIVVGALLSTLLIKWRFVRLLLMAVLAAWSVYAGSMSLRCSGVLPGRVLLAIYPLGLMYSVLSWLVVIT